MKKFIYSRLSLQLRHDFKSYLADCYKRGSDEAKDSDLALTPKEIWKKMNYLAGFTEESTMDPFKYNRLFSRLWHFNGFSRKLSARDIFMNPPYSNRQAALSLRKALVLYFAGANVCLLIP
jgi:hypothetical protein